MPRVAVRSSALLFSFMCLAIGCNDKKSEPGAREGTPPPIASDRTESVCKSGGGTIKDAPTAALLPRSAGGFCVSPTEIDKAYGEGAKFEKSQICTTAVDGECEVYFKYGLKRMGLVTYVDGSGRPSSVNVMISQFEDAKGAYGMFTKRVIAGSDPAEATVKPLSVGGAAAQSRSNVYLWKGNYLAELQVLNEDPNFKPEDYARLTEAVGGALAKAIAEKVPGTAELPAIVQLLPDADRVPLGLEYVVADALGQKELGAAAMGYYRAAGKRARYAVWERESDDKAKAIMGHVRTKHAGAAEKGLADEGVVAELSASKDQPKQQWVFARKGARVYAVGDEELAPSAGKLTRDEKVLRLRAWLASADKAPSGAASTASSSASSAPKVVEAPIAFDPNGACAGGGGTLKDAVSSALLPKGVTGYCLSPTDPGKAYGEGAKLEKGKICTTAVDGECEVYFANGLRRMSFATYIDQSKKPISFNVMLSQYDDAAGAYGMFTKRVVADGDPAQASVKPASVGGAAATSKSNLYMWKGPYLLELQLLAEDPNLRPEDWAKIVDSAGLDLARAIAGRLPGSSDPIAAVRLLPTDGRLPLGVQYFRKDTPGFSSLTGAAVGFYSAAGKRYRIVAAPFTEARAKELYASLKSGGAPLPDVGDEAHVTPKGDAIVVRKGGTVLVVSDEELAAAAPKLSKDEKVARAKAAAAALK